MNAAVPDAALSLPAFLASDFAKLDGQILQRCMRLHGHRLYLSGATGFFGQNILALLSELHRLGAEFKVTALSRAPEGFLRNRPWYRELSWLEWQQGDVSSPWPGAGTYDFLLHAATDTSAEANASKLDVFERILEGSRRALAFAAAHDVRRLLLAGSGAEYGAIPGCFANGIPESSALGCDASKPESAYGEGKRVSELLAALHAERHGFSVVNTRCFAFVGPGLALDGHFAIGNFVRDALLGRPIQLASQGESVRSYLYGADLAVWLIILLLEAERGATVNVGSDVRIRVLDLANRIRDLINPRLSVRIGEDKPSEERHFYVPSIDRAKRLGLGVWTDLDQAIARTAMWYCDSRGAA